MCLYVRARACVRACVSVCICSRMGPRFSMPFTQQRCSKISNLLAFLSKQNSFLLKRRLLRRRLLRRRLLKSPSFELVMLDV